MGNIALNKPATASAFVMPYAAANAVSGTITPFSRWLCNTVPCWMGVDTGNMYLVNRWVVRHMPVAGWQSPDYAISDFKLQGSLNNSAWVDLDTVTNNSASIVDRTLPAPVAYRYFRVYITKGLRANPQMTSIVEFEVYQTYSCSLTNLAISAGTLTPAFNMNTLAYAATVDASVASINVTPTAQDPQAAIKVNGATAVSGQPKAVALSYGSNTITVNVTDGSGAQKNYILTVTRQGSLLSSLTVQTDTGVNIPLTPIFASGTQAYTASVINAVGKVTFTPTAQKSTATITIKGDAVTNGVVSKTFDVGVGSNAIPVVVTADGVSFTYTVTITRASASVNLLLDHVMFNYSGRTIQPGSVNVSMIDTQTEYPVIVPAGATGVTVSPTARDASVIIKVNNVPVQSGGTSGSIPLNSTGTTAVTIVTSSPDGTTSRTYTFTISKGTI